MSQTGDDLIFTHHDAHRSVNVSRPYDCCTLQNNPIHLHLSALLYGQEVANYYSDRPQSRTVRHSNCYYCSCFVGRIAFFTNLFTHFKQISLYVKINTYLFSYFTCIQHSEQIQ